MAGEKALITLRVALGKKIKFYRKKKGLTQEQLAELTESTPQTLSGIERGRNFPSFALLSNIIEALEISPHQLFLFDNNKLDTKSTEFASILVEKFENTTYEQRQLVYSILEVSN